MSLPTKFVCPEYDGIFLSVHVRAFAHILQRASAKEHSWKTFLADLHKHDLLTFTTPREIVLGPIVIEQTRLGDRHYRDHIVVELNKPIPCGFDRHSIDIERDRLTNSAYLEETASILAYMWGRKLLPAETESSHLALLHMTEDLLGKCLRRLHRGQSTGDSVARFVLSATISPLVDDLAPIKALDDFGKSLANETAGKFAIFLANLSADLNSDFAAAKQHLSEESAAASKALDERFTALEAETAARFASGAVS